MSSNRRIRSQGGGTQGRRVRELRALRGAGWGRGRLLDASAAEDHSKRVLLVHGMAGHVPIHRRSKFKKVLFTWT